MPYTEALGVPTFPGVGQFRQVRLAADMAEDMGRVWRVEERAVAAEACCSDYAGKAKREWPVFSKFRIDYPHIHIFPPFGIFIHCYG